MRRGESKRAESPFVHLFIINFLQAQYCASLFQDNGKQDIAPVLYELKT